MSVRSSLCVLLLLATLPLAGCVDTPAAEEVAPDALPEGLAPTLGVLHGPDGATLDPALAGTVPRAVGLARAVGLRSFEPTLGVNQAGVLFMTAFHPDAPGPTVVRSRDQGATWENVGPRLPTGHGNPPITGDPYVYVDPGTGRVFMSDLQLCNYLSWSDDEGGSWTTNPLPCGHPIGFDDHQTLVAAKPRKLPTVGYANVLYYCINRVYDAACTTSLNGGLAWGPFVPTWPADFNGRVCGGLHGHAAAGPDGRVYLGRVHCGAVEVAWTEDDGLTWTRSRIDSPLPPEGHEVSVAVDEAGGVHALWMAEGLPHLASSLDGGRTWTAPAMVAAPGVTAADFPALAAGAAGRLVVAYVGTTLEGGYEGRQTSAPNPLAGAKDTRQEDWANATWHAYVGLVTLDASGAVATIQTVTANDPADPVARGLCGHTRCSGIGDFIHAEVGPDGRPWAAFVDVCTEGCATDPGAKNDAPVGFAGTLAQGPSLRGEAGAMLPPLA